MVHVVLISRDPSGEERYPEAYSSDSFTRLYLADDAPINGTTIRPKALKATTSEGDTLTLASTAYYAPDYGVEIVGQADTKAWAKEILLTYLKKIAAVKPGGYLLMSDVLAAVELKLPEANPDTAPVDVVG